MDLVQNFKEFIRSNNLFQHKDRLILAVSGGVDSVSLCELCKQAGYDFVIAHCNFKLREQHSDADEKFVRSLAEKYGVTCFVKSFETIEYASATRQSIETAARELRYQWFNELLNQPSEKPFRYTLTGHHADDNIETVLMNFFRGTGINGLRGILPKQGNIVRPLLFARRSELEQFIQKSGLQFVTDHTNLQNDYTRNFFRNKIIPLVSESYPEAANNVLRNIHRFQETEMLYRQSVEFHKKKLLEQKGNEIHIPVLKLATTKPLATIIYEIIKDFEFTAHQVNEVIALLKSETGKYILSASFTILRNRKWLIISPRQTVEAANILIEENGETVPFSAGTLQIQQFDISSARLSDEAHIAMLDSSVITFPLLLRKWKQGDYFYPLGMQRKKKLSRFFIDQKLSISQKEKTWVLETNKKIAWIVGMRIDDRFKITGSTKQVLQLHYKSK